MIEQQRYPIENVPKYNFSDATFGGFELPRGLVDLCLCSLKKLRPPFVGSSSVEQGANLCDSDVTFQFDRETVSFDVIPLQPTHESVPVAAVDVSSMRIGETEEGMLVAVRGAIVWHAQRSYRYLRIGPFILHITEENKKQVFNLLRQYHLNSSADAVAPDFLHLQTSLASIFERWIQTRLCVASSNSLILFDGSLTSGTTDAPEDVLAKLLQTARTRMNIILALSKSSHLHFNGRCLTDVACKCTPPCLVKVVGLSEQHKGFFRLLGDIYVAKLSEDAVSFRLDIDKELSQTQAVEAVQRMLGNDLFHQGYPETLRLAHIYSTFTASEVIGMQHYLTQERELEILIRPNLRRILFGPFGKGSEG